MLLTRDRRDFTLIEAVNENEDVVGVQGTRRTFLAEFPVRTVRWPGAFDVGKLVCFQIRCNSAVTPNKLNVRALHALVSCVNAIYDYSVESHYSSPLVTNIMLEGMKPKCSCLVINVLDFWRGKQRRGACC